VYTWITYTSISEN